MENGEGKGESGIHIYTTNRGNKGNRVNKKEKGKRGKGEDKKERGEMGKRGWEWHRMRYSIYVYILFYL